MALTAYLHYDINFYAMLLLVAVLAVMHWRRDSSGYATRLYRRVVFANLVVLVLEVLSWAFDRQPGETNRLLNYAFNWVFISLNPLVPCLWAAYIDYRIFGSPERLKQRIYYSHIIILSTVLMIANFFHPIVFEVSGENVYSRGPGLWVILLVIYGQMLYLVLVAYRNRRRVRDQVLVAIFAIVSAPAVGAAVQLLVFGVFLTWPLMALAITMTYVILETVTASRDYLTGLASRFRADDYIQRLVENRASFGLAIIDLDDFKYINDNLGHQAGDQHLKYFAEVLRKVFADARLVGRLGGDEFVAVTRDANLEEMSRYRESLRLALLRSSLSDIRTNLLRFSYGTVVYNGEPGVSWDDLYARADKAMYTDKAINKNRKRRVSDR
ncbi:MAG: diguanylate cyclase domain-containing protein [Spirochaetaceae bacterium]